MLLLAVLAVAVVASTTAAYPLQQRQKQELLLPGEEDEGRTQLNQVKKRYQG